jgi:AmmeMemoRadiSam system protein A
MNNEQKQILLKTARDTVKAVITNKLVPTPQSDDPELKVNCGCFVTLKNRGQLRGCIGQFTSEVPLIELVVEMAKASATGDPRFFGDPIRPDELGQLDVEISVLSPLKRTENPLSLQLGVGLLSTPGRHRDRLEQGGVSLILLCT